MKVSIRALAPVLLLLGACAPAMGTAQTPPQQPQQEVRFITITKIQMPQDTLDARALLTMIDSVFVPQARMNPNVLSYRVLQHNWGANSRDVLILAEYPNWAAIEAECQECDEWLRSKTPAEGTPERARWNAMQADALPPRTASRSGVGPLRGIAVRQNAVASHLPNVAAAAGRGPGRRAVFDAGILARPLLRVVGSPSAAPVRHAGPAPLPTRTER
jgi:hypothetical protein